MPDRDHLGIATFRPTVAAFFLLPFAAAVAGVLWVAEKVGLIPEPADPWTPGMGENR
jgi:hypothetical protein